MRVTKGQLANAIFFRSFCQLPGTALYTIKITCRADKNIYLLEFSIIIVVADDIVLDDQRILKNL